MREQETAHRWATDRTESPAQCGAEAHMPLLPDRSGKAERGQRFSLISALRDSNPIFFGLFIIIAILVGYPSSTGCGGGGGNKPTPTPSPTPPGRRVLLTIEWAERTRNVSPPASALSATIKMPGTRVGGGDLTFTVDRDNNAAKHTRTYESNEEVYIGKRRMEATFFSQPGAAGSIVATASSDVTIGDDGRVLDTITNVQNRIKSVTVASGQSLTVGEEKYLTFTARDVSGAIVAVTNGSAKFATSSNALSLTGIVAKAIQAGDAQVTATVDGITSQSVIVTVFPAIKIAYVANGQNANVITILQVLQGRNITPTRFDSIPEPSTLQEFDVLMLGESGNIGKADADRVKTFLDAGRGVVLLGRSPQLLANGETQHDSDVTPISAWFGNVRQMGTNRLDVYARSAPGLFPLPASVSPGERVYQPVPSDSMPDIVTTDILNPLVDQVTQAENFPLTVVHAFAYELPGIGGNPGGRVYWQWDAIGKNTNYTNKVLSLLLAGANWAARRQ